MAIIDGVEYANEDEEVDAFFGPDGYLHVLESVEVLKEEESERLM